MLCSFVGTSRKRQSRVFLLCLTVLILCPFALLATHLMAFARSMQLHTVSERDLSIDYQRALNVSLQTNPCCDAAKWTPNPAEILQEQIPRIIHQTYKTTTLPPGDWQTAHDLCLNIHPATDHWRHILWTDESAEVFIAQEFPEFLDTYKHYPYPIQRVDAMRYFILYHYGGVYIDLDIGCARSMLSLLHFPAFLPKTQPLGVSNDLIGSRPGHPFMRALGGALLSQGPNKWYGTMYLTVFFTTGPMSVNRVLSRYWRSTSMTTTNSSNAAIATDVAIAGTGKSNLADSVYILPTNFYSESLTAYFMHFPGSSWHGSDASSALWLYNYSWLLPLIGISAFCGYFAKTCSGRSIKRRIQDLIRGEHRERYKAASVV